MLWITTAPMPPSRAVHLEVQFLHQLRLISILICTFCKRSLRLDDLPKFQLRTLHSAYIKLPLQFQLGAYFSLRFPKYCWWLLLMQNGCCDYPRGGCITRIEADYLCAQTVHCEGAPRGKDTVELQGIIVFLHLGCLHEWRQEHTWWENAQAQQSYIEHLPPVASHLWTATAVWKQKWRKKIKTTDLIRKEFLEGAWKRPI